MKVHPSHKNNLDALRRIEGQIRGVHKMIEDKRYCVDILTQLGAVNGAIGRLRENILEKHLNGCVKTALTGKSEKEKNKKIGEVIGLLRKFKNNG